MVGLVSTSLYTQETLRGHYISYKSLKLHLNSHHLGQQHGLEKIPLLEEEVCVKDIYYREVDYGGYIIPPGT